MQEIPARVGVRKGEVSPKVTDYLVGKQLEGAIASGQELDISWPFQDGDITDWTQAEALWYACCCFPARPLSVTNALLMHR
jgi:actin-related protein 9